MYVIVCPKKFENLEDALMHATKLIVESGLSKDDLVVKKEEENSNGIQKGMD